MNLCGGADSVPAARCSVAGDRGDGLVRLSRGAVSAQANLADVILGGIREIELAAGRRCTARTVIQPGGCAAAERADSCCAYVDSTERIRVAISNIERITDLDDPIW